MVVGYFTRLQDLHVYKQDGTLIAHLSKTTYSTDNPEVIAELDKHPELNKEFYRAVLENDKPSEPIEEPELEITVNPGVINTVKAIRKVKK